MQVAGAFARGDYLALVELLVVQNQEVMKLRGSPQGWIDLEKGVLKVRFRDERGNLPSLEALPDLWRFPYFFDSLHRIGCALRGPKS